MGTACVPKGELVRLYPSWECRPMVPIQRKRDICMMVLPHKEQRQTADRRFLKLPGSSVVTPSPEQPGCVLCLSLGKVISSHSDHSSASVVPSPKAHWCLSEWPWVSLMPPMLAGLPHSHYANNTQKNPQPWLRQGEGSVERKRAGIPTPAPAPLCSLLSSGPWAAYLLSSDIL